MRKPDKHKLLEYLDSLSEAGRVAAKTIRSGAVTELQDLLAQMQELAIAAGTEIERTEGEGTEAVRILEEYCEQLFRVGEACAEDPERAKKDADKHTARLEGCLRRERDALNAIPMRREVVFLPYKASMWDSLESIWRAADRDPSCDAYVVPIPYYDKNPDGSFREVHYEGDLYPSYVPVVHYNDYAFEQRRPDVIFIHNPYDEINYVTSVHPFFYSKHLKEFTDRLVYVPYFLLGDIDPDDPAQVEQVTDFAVAPGVLFSDYTIVQSDEMARAYVNAIEGYLHEGYGARYQNKILGLGSPKVDKVRHTKREDLDIPDAWRKIIEREDGTYKKIIFYNTTITGILRNNMDAIEKIKRVFRVFREQKDRVALLWRPHPLIEATLTSMRPDLWEAYRAVRDAYIEEGMGIYDDTPDMDRAVVLCDAYYGDGSSIVWLCRAAGKPVMIQNCRV